MVLLPSIGTLVFPCFGLIALNKTENDKAKSAIQNEMEFMNKHLSTRTFLVGERLSLADITTFSVLKMLFEHVLDEAARRPLVHMTRWFLTVANQENVKSVVGELNMCEVPSVFDAKKYAELHPKKETKKADKAEKKDEKEIEKPKKPKKLESEDEDEPLVPAEKETDPYKLLPAGKFNMEEWKRVYSNNDIDTVALKYFWENFDTENYSLWTCEYLFPEELAFIFMTCNLVSGMFQRLEKLRKYAFGSMVVLGKDRDNTIKGLWVWRGQDLAFPLSADCSLDYDLYKWEKLDVTSQETKDSVRQYFLHEGNFGEKAFNQGKIFK
jgi:elongation factor 1-gamma